MKYQCPNRECQHHQNPEPGFYIKKGYYKTKHNHQPVPRYQCKTCRVKFSSHTFRDTYRQRKPQLNQRVFEAYVSGTTQRRLAKLLRCNRKTIVRKFLWLADKAKVVHESKISNGDLKTSFVQFDELETYEHTKLKPLSVSIAVRPKTGEIIDIAVGSMKAKGHLADLGFVRYGEREDTRKLARESVLSTVAKCAKSSITVISDSHPSYPTLIKKHLPKARFETINGRHRKFEEFDRMFMLNHVCALLRHDLSRLRRKTWTTTKSPERLLSHLYLYIAFRNGYDLSRGI